MTHPVFKNYKTFISYLAGWIPIVFIHQAYFYFSIKVPLTVSTGISIINTYIFALLGLGLWFMVYYGNESRKISLSSILYHPLLALIFVGIWYGITEVLTNSLSITYTLINNQFVVLKIITGLILYSILILVFYVIKYSLKIQQKLVLEEKLQKEIRQAELSALKNQINPHFLFNSLNSISSLITSEGEKAKEMVIQLSEFIRYSLRQKNEMVSLKTELEQCYKYLNIEKVRFGDRLVIKNQIPKEAMDCELPPLILQPLYENAIKHGVYESIDEVIVSTFVRIGSKYLIINIENNFDKDALPRKGEGIGLINIENRLALIYKEYGLLETIKTENTFTALVKIPLLKTP